MVPSGSFEDEASTLTTRYVALMENAAVGGIGPGAIHIHCEPAGRNRHNGNRWYGLSAHGDPLLSGSGQTFVVCDKKRYQVCPVHGVFVACHDAHRSRAVTEVPCVGNNASTRVNGRRSTTLNRERWG